MDVCSRRPRRPFVFAERRHRQQDALWPFDKEIKIKELRRAIAAEKAPCRQTVVSCERRPQFPHLRVRIMDDIIDMLQQSLAHAL